MTILKFTKMHSLGNDFMVIDGTKNNFTPSSSQLKQWGIRKFGIGFDQLLLVENSTKLDCDFTYRVFNSDGFEVEMCGNGARCFMKFVIDKKLTNKVKLSVETSARKITLMKDDDSYQVNMGPADFDPMNIPIKFFAKEYYELDFEGEKLQFQAVSIGNPHAVFVVDNLEYYPITEVSEFVQTSDTFPNGVNVNFMKIINNTEIRLRTFERGVGETLACGSGACAAVACGIKSGQLTQISEKPIKAIMQGGQLAIMQNTINDIIMIGDAFTVYEGTVKI